MGAVIDVENPFEVRRAGLQALTEALGPDGMRAFMQQSLLRTGNMTEDKYNRPETPMEELVEELRRIDAEYLAGHKP